MNIIQTILLPIGGYFEKQSIYAKEFKAFGKTVSNKCLSKKLADFISLILKLNSFFNNIHPIFFSFIIFTIFVFFIVLIFQKFSLPN